MVYPNNKEFCSYDILGTLDKQYVLAGNHSFVKSRQCIIFFRSYDIAGTLDKQYVLAGYHSFLKSGQHIIVF